MKNGQKFMMIFSYTPNPEYQPSAQEIAQMSEDWGSFIGNIAIKEKLESVHQLGFNGKRISFNLLVSDGIQIFDSKTISGTMVVKANSLDEAIEMAKDSPILKMGGSVEVRDIMPM